ncbi:MAG: hypothetical protein EOM14_16200, partial [Clostridia bacterium]|nr:hypothetical protein [Clostridia bacterium]
MNEDKQNWPKSNVELANFLGVTDNAIRQHKRRHAKELTEGVDFSSADLKVPNAPTFMTIWFKTGAIKLAHYCRSDKARIFLEREGIQKLHKNSVEGDIIGIIADSVYGITTCKKQYTVEGYR